MRPFRFTSGCSLVACLLAVSLTVACSRSEPTERPRAIAAPQPAAPGSGSGVDDRPRVVALGDSLTAGHGLLSEESYPALLQHLFDTEGYNIEVVNAGVSGDTTAGGLRRLDWALQGEVRVLIVALGGNDGLRGISVLEMKQNLAAIIERAQERQISVLLAGMEAPPNFGSDYTRTFRQVFRDLAREYHVTLLPFFLNGVAGNPALNQPDGIHPNAAGTRQVAETLWATLKPMVDAAEAR